VNHPHLTSVGPLSLVFRLSGEIVPKARPRVTSRSTYMPENYTRWKEYAIRSFEQQKQGYDDLFPIRQCSIKIIIRGAHSKRGDADNITGSIFDALVQAKVLRNDNLTCIQEFSFKFTPTKESVIACIVLNPMESHIKQKLYVDC
jgi:Holliday junction resolvase RusA-like endonuclease